MEFAASTQNTRPDAAFPVRNEVREADFRSALTRVAIHVNPNGVHSLARGWTAHAGLPRVSRENAPPTPTGLHHSTRRIPARNDATPVGLNPRALKPRGSPAQAGQPRAMDETPLGFGEVCLRKPVSVGSLANPMM